jgi:D-glycero-D-manno-heptose 1,7-bisphosphate phosphatase
LIPGIKKSLEELNKKGYFLFIISNQPDVSRGNIEEGTLEKINQIILEKFPIKEIMICPHNDYNNCKCRKPKPGMLLNLAVKWDINLKKSYLIGDNWKDIQAGKAAGCTTILLDKSYNIDIKADYRVHNLKNAVKTILARN